MRELLPIIKHDNQGSYSPSLRELFRQFEGAFPLGDFAILNVSATCGGRWDLEPSYKRVRGVIALVFALELELKNLSESRAPRRELLLLGRPEAARNQARTQRRGQEKEIGPNRRGTEENGNLHESVSK